MLKVALAYLSYGWSIFPLRPRSKVPAVSTWEIFQKERATEQLVRTWWKNNPNFNIAIVTGAISGLFVVDCDSERLIAEHEGLPDYANTLKSITANGKHYFYQLPGFRVGNRAGEGVLHIRGDGGYVTAPPSIHPSGVRYRWERAPIQQCPPHAILELIKPKPAPRYPAGNKPRMLPGRNANEITRGYFDEQCNRIQLAGEGYRNATLFAGAIMAGHFVRDGRMSRLEAETGLAMAGLAAGLGENEVTKTIRSGIERGLNDPRIR